MTPCTVKSLGISRTRWNELKRHAVNSIYRLNATSADCYAFRIETAGEKYLDGTISRGGDFRGGWDWSADIVDKSATYILVLSDSKLYAL